MQLPRGRTTIIIPKRHFMEDIKAITRDWQIKEVIREPKESKMKHLATKGIELSELKNIAKNYDIQEKFVDWGLTNTGLSTRQLEHIWEDAIKEAGLIPKEGKATLPKTKMKHLANKEPWQMTKEEYVLKPIEKLKEQDKKAIQPGSEIRYGRPVTYYETANYKAVEKRMEFEHKQAIQQALSEGKPVPYEVLEDYPDLQYEKGFKEVFPEGIPTPTREQMETGRMKHLD